MRSSLRVLLPGAPRTLPQKVAFDPIVELFVGSELDWSFSKSYHRIEGPVECAAILAGQFRSPRQEFALPAGDVEQTEDVVSFLAHHAAARRDLEHADIMDMQDVVHAEDDDLEAHADGDSRSDSSWSSVRRSDWHSTMIFSSEGEAIPRILDWNGRHIMHQKHCSCSRSRSCGFAYVPSCQCQTC